MVIVSERREINRLEYKLEPDHNCGLFLAFMIDWKIKDVSTAIPYRVSKRPEKGFPCKFFPNKEKSVFITGIPANENRVFPVGKNSQGKPCFHYRDGFAVSGPIVLCTFSNVGTICICFCCGSTVAWQLDILIGQAARCHASIHTSNINRWSRH